jgi:methylase of polypeptide subunit release factors
MKASKRVLMRGNAMIRRSLFNRPAFVRRMFGVDVAPDPTAQSYCEWNTILFRMILPRYLRPRMRVLDMGTGAHGLLAIAAKKMRDDIEVTASDIVPDRIDHARETARRNRVDLEFRVASMFDGMPGPFDLILFAPPIIPSDELGELGYQWQEIPGLGTRRCWSSDGGANGMEILEPFLRKLQNHLAEGGIALVTINPSHCPGHFIRELCDENSLAVQRVHHIPGVVDAYVLEGKCPAR